MKTHVRILFVVAVVLVGSLATAENADAAVPLRRLFSRGFRTYASAVTAPADGTVRRSLSYEPAISGAATYRSNQSFSAPKEEPWQYPKTAPRRYRL